MDKTEIARQLAALRPVKRKTCEAPDCGAEFDTVTPNRSRWCSDRCRFRAAAARKRAAKLAENSS